MPTDGSKTDKAVRQFWDKYIILLGKKAIKPAQQRWFVRRAEKYISHYAKQKLATHSPEQVTQYFHVLGRQDRLKDWQFIQAVRAIRILFCDLIQSDWASGFDWDHWIDAAQTLDPDHATLARESSHPDKSLLPEAGEGSLLENISAQHPKWVQRLITEIRRRDYSIRTEQAYLHWLCRFIAYHKDIKDFTGDHIVTYLEQLAVKRNVSASTQSQALNALVFFYKNILEQPVDDLGNFVRAKRPKRLPTVLSRQEVQAILENMTGSHYLMTSLLYGAGLRLMERVRLRVMDIDFSYGQIKIHMKIIGGQRAINPYIRCRLY